MSTFTGSYISDIKSALTASLLAGQNALLIGAPGYGKTAVARSLAQQVTDGHFSFVRVDPSTPVEAVKGAYDPAEFLNGRLVRVVAGTPYAPDCRLAIVDEIGRGNEMLFDALLDTLDRVDRDDAPPVWATTNFMPQKDRTAALIDRFALWVWVQPDALDIGAVVSAQLAGSRPQVDMSGVPAWDEIQAVRQMTPNAGTRAAVADKLRDLSSKAAAEGRGVHPRRLTQWANIVYRVGAWKTGQADFQTIPDEAIKPLRYAWPALTAEESASWAQIAGSVIDAVGAAIESALAQVLAKMRELSAAPASQRPALVMGVAQLMQSTQTTLAHLAGSDNERVQKAIGDMNSWLALAARGEEVK